MEQVLLIHGNVKYTITLDPSVWIFDDRKEELETVFDSQKVEENLENNDEQAGISKYWAREILEGAVSPPTLETEKKFEKEKLLNGNYCMRLSHFLKNAEINEDAKELVIETKNGDVRLPIDKGEHLILFFAKNGRPLKEDGPVHCYFGDGSNKDEPITHVKGFRIE